MKNLLNVVLGTGAAVSAAVLLLQGFALPALAPTLGTLLRCATTICIQWLFLRMAPKKAIQAIPLLVSAIAAVWGFFLFLSSPSWYGATFGSFLSDYASFFLGCALVWAASLLLPRIIPRVKKAAKEKKQKKNTFVK